MGSEQDRVSGHGAGPVAEGLLRSATSLRRQGTRVGRQSGTSKDRFASGGGSASEVAVRTTERSCDGGSEPFGTWVQPAIYQRRPVMQLLFAPAADGAAQRLRAAELDTMPRPQPHWAVPVLSEAGRQRSSASAMEPHVDNGVLAFRPCGDGDMLGGRNIGVRALAAMQQLAASGRDAGLVDTFNASAPQSGSCERSGPLRSGSQQQRPPQMFAYVATVRPLVGSHLFDDVL